MLPLWFATGANYNTWHARCLAIRLVVIVKTFSFTSGQCMSYMVCSPKAGTRTCKPSHIHMIQLMVVMLHFCNTSGCLQVGLPCCQALSQNAFSNFSSQWIACLISMDPTHPYQHGQLAYQQSCCDCQS